MQVSGVGQMVMGMIPAPGVLNTESKYPFADMTLRQGEEGDELLGDFFAVYPEDTDEGGVKKIKKRLIAAVQGYTRRIKKAGVVKKFRIWIAKDGDGKEAVFVACTADSTVQGEAGEALADGVADGVGAPTAKPAAAKKKSTGSKKK